MPHFIFNKSNKKITSFDTAQLIRFIDQVELDGNYAVNQEETSNETMVQMPVVLVRKQFHFRAIGTNQVHMPH